MTTWFCICPHHSRNKSTSTPQSTKILTIDCCPRVKYPFQGKYIDSIKILLPRFPHSLMQRLKQFGLMNLVSPTSAPSSESLSESANVTFSRSLLWTYRSILITLVFTATEASVAGVDFSILILVWWGDVRSWMYLGWYKLDSWASEMTRNPGVMVHTYHSIFSDDELVSIRYLKLTTAGWYGEVRILPR